MDPNGKQLLTYDVVLEPSDEGGYTVHVPALKGCVSEGETEEEAIDNIKDAIQVWLDSWEEVAEKQGSILRKVVIER